MAILLYRPDEYEDDEDDDGVEHLLLLFQFFAFFGGGKRGLFFFFFYIIVPLENTHTLAFFSSYMEKYRRKKISTQFTLIIIFIIITRI